MVCGLDRMVGGLLHTSQTEPRSAPRSELKVQNTFHSLRAGEIRRQVDDQPGGHRAPARRRSRGTVARRRQMTSSAAEQEQRIELRRRAEADQHAGQHRPAARPRPERARHERHRQEVPVDQAGQGQRR